MKQISIEDIQRITLEEIEEYVKSKYKYKVQIANNKLIIEHQKKRLEIGINDRNEYTCYNDYKWISIYYMNQKTLCGHGYGLAAKDFDFSIIDYELTYFEE